MVVAEGLLQVELMSGTLEQLEEVGDRQTVYLQQAFVCLCIPRWLDLLGDRV